MVQQKLYNTESDKSTGGQMAHTRTKKYDKNYCLTSHTTESKTK